MTNRAVYRTGKEHVLEVHRFKKRTCFFLAWILSMFFALTLNAQDKPRSIVGMMESYSDLTKEAQSEYAYALVHQCSGLILAVDSYSWLDNDPSFSRVKENLTRIGLTYHRSNNANENFESFSRESAVYAVEYNNWLGERLKRGLEVSRYVVEDELKVCLDVSSIKQPQ